MRYLEARDLIKDGDLIAVKGTGLISDITKFVTDSIYSHTGIAIWLDGGLWLSQMTSGGNNLIPLSQESCFDVFECPVNPASVRTYVLEKLRTRINYSFLDLIVAGLTSITKFKIPTTNTGLICSAASTKTYLANGWDIITPPVPTPGWVASRLKMKLSITNN
jgi:hypothetical protein